MAVNSVTLVGRLSNKPELNQTKNGKAYTRFSLAVEKPGKDAGASFISCVAWEKRAETISKYVDKGDKFLVMGRLDQSLYEKDGQKQSFVSVVVDNFEFLESKQKEAQEPVGTYIPNAHGKGEIDLSSIPF